MRRGRPEGLRGRARLDRNLREIAALRQLLEGSALEQSFRAGDMEWEATRRCRPPSLVADGRAHGQGDRSGTEEWKQYDWQFHQALISACGSKMLIDTHAAVFDKYLRYQMIALSYRGEIAAREHALLLDCALKRDAAKAREVLTQPCGRRRRARALDRHDQLARSSARRSHWRKRPCRADCTRP